MPAAVGGEGPGVACLAVEQPPQRPSPAILAAFAGAVFIGGTNFLAVKFSNEDLAPLYGATVRFAAASLLLFGIAAAARIPLPRGRSALGASIYGLLGFGFAYGLMYFALVGLGAGTTSVIAAAVPLVTLILAVFVGQEMFSLRGVIGGMLAIAGIGILSLRSLGGDIRPIYFVTAVLAVFAIAGSSVAIKGFPPAHPVTTNALGMSVGTIFLAIVSLIRGEQWVAPAQPRTWWVLVYLVVVGSVLLFLLFLFVIRRWTASASAYALTLMPLVAVTLGVLFADEALTWELLVGAALVMAAVYIGALSSRSTPAPVDPHEPPAAAVAAPE